VGHTAPGIKAVEGRKPTIRAEAESITMQES
jgi:hypothetical protein